MKVAQLNAETLRPVVRVGVDLAKSVFAVVAVDRREQVVVKRMLNRGAFERFLVSLPAGCVVAMEACGGAPAWGRFRAERGLRPMLLPPQAVKPYIGEQKNDLRDARGICEAAGRPTIQPVRLKSAADSDLQMVVRVREGRVAARTAKSNQIRGFLVEYGLSLPRGAAALKQQVPALLEDAENGLSMAAREVLASLLWEWRAAEAQVAEADDWLRRLERDRPASRTLQRIPGIGPVTALAWLALVGDGRQFKNGRAVAAWLGLTPQQRRQDPAGAVDPPRPGLPAHALD